MEATPAWLLLKPAKTAFRLRKRRRSRKGDIVQVTFGQCGQQSPLLLALAPDVQRFADLREKTGTMMIIIDSCVKMDIFVS